MANLLMNVNLPSESQSTAWKFVVSQFSAVPRGILDIIQTMVHAAHPIGVLVKVMTVLFAFHPDAHSILVRRDLYQSKQVWFPQSVLVFLSSFINSESPDLPSFDSPDMVLGHRQQYHSQTTVCKGEPENDFESTTRVDLMVSIGIDID
ncbi:hypothetical protein PVL29_017484 [Vitis rotundifolia]|uniref:Uncharacterized protein n=1 Tax=Vitis rotundifolia TaxID=103349 RepID=A0AA39DKJ8_VITRO|nr:hypothetical protein PVL29_017484 [Vitis rotundifolia]